MMQSQNTQDKSSKEYQRQAWDQLKKSLNGNINKINVENVKTIIPKIFELNLIRGRGLFCRSVIRAQSFSPTFTPVYAALVAVINTKIPLIGDLLVSRLVDQFRKAFRRDQKSLCLATTSFIAQLTNQRVCHELLAFQIIQLLLENPTDDSIEVAVGFTKQIGSLMLDIAPRVLNATFETFRSVLHEAEIDKRVQYMIEVLFQIRRDGFKDYPVIPEGLDLIEEDEQVVHEISLDDEELDIQDELNVFREDKEYLQNEEKYAEIKREILGDSDSSGDEDGESESGSDGDSDSGSSEEESDDEDSKDKGDSAVKAVIRDRTETELINLRRTIYLTVMSSAIFEETVHKLLKLDIQPGDEIEICNMIIECCAQERTYQTYYGLIGERLCKLSRSWRELFAQTFTETYENIHRFEVNRLRNVAKLFATMLATDGLPWSCLSCIKLTEEDTTSSSRIFLKQLLQDISEQMGLQSLVGRINDPDLAEATKGMFPDDNPRHVRFAINYFTSIGLGALTEELRELLKKMAELRAQQHDGSDSDSDSDDSDADSSSSGSDSDSSGTDSGSETDASSVSKSSRSVSSDDGARKSWRKRQPGTRRDDSYSKSDGECSRSRSRSSSVESGRLSVTSSRSPSRSRSPSPRPSRRPGGYRRVRSPSRSPSPQSGRSRSQDRSLSPYSKRARLSENR
ncbi:pre-mRNA-splicing factor cwc22 [Mycoemilia scoparia]|uniref:Pre-mRNA-splicing factor cwc22 n=1 Tax=Mycoemilia scoparia TaxID=417184 RepID=A0A9W8A160_9FUNG|nr:pre-mRNA-splicing factor cwc22 [Mycoemilia scoparia]